MDYEARRIRQFIRTLREECPTSMGFPVMVRRTHRAPPRSDLVAWTSVRQDGKGFLIVIRRRFKPRRGRVRRMTLEETLSILIHEWAHAMSWTPEHHTLTDHDASFGVAYSRAYGAVVED